MKELVALLETESGEILDVPIATCETASQAQCAVDAVGNLADVLVAMPEVREVLGFRVRNEGED